MDVCMLSACSFVPVLYLWRCVTMLLTRLGTRKWSAG